MKNGVFLLVGICINAVLAQNSGISIFNRKCDQKSECILLARCPPLLVKAVSKNSSIRREVQGLICSFRQKRVYVCCAKTIQKTVPTRTLIFGNRQELLPKKCGQPATDDRIFGGERAPIGAYPWMVALGFKVNGGSTISFECSGSLINYRYVLTAAHCLMQPGVELASLNLGDWDIENPGIDCEQNRLGMRCSSAPHLVVGFEAIIIHEDYNKRFQLSDDIALIRLDRDLDFKKLKTLMQPVCMPPANFDPSTVSNGIYPIAAGWGFTEHGNKSNILLRVKIPFATHQNCSDIYKERFSTSQICAGGEKGFDSCGGDSGGPLVLSGPNGPPFQQIGIVSYGPRVCGQENFPAVYTSVAKYRKWIENHLKP